MLQENKNSVHGGSSPIQFSWKLSINSMKNFPLTYHADETKCGWFRREENRKLKKHQKPQCIYSGLWFNYHNDTALLTGSIHKPPPFFFFLNVQLWHNRRHLETGALCSDFNRLRAVSGSTFSPRLSSLILCRRPRLSLSPSPSSSTALLRQPPSPPSPGQLLIRGRNDRCFARQKSSLVCLSANGRCAVHIYFRGLKNQEKKVAKVFYKSQKLIC